MTQAEARKLVAVLMVTYPNYKPISTDLAVNVWEETLKEQDYKMVSAALTTYIKTNTSGFAPTPAHILANIKTLSMQDEPNESQAWGKVRFALRNSIYNSEKEFEKLPETVKKAVGSASQLRAWAMSEDFNEDVESSHFRRAYRAVLEREAKLQSLPVQMQERIQDGYSEGYKGIRDNIAE